MYKRQIISCTIIDEYTRWSAINELNFHFINTHFMHPDDVLDVDRGAAKGWNAMRDEFDKYLNWLYSSAPNLRNTTSSEASMAVQRYDVLSLKRTYADNKLTLNIDNFYDEAYFFVRIQNRRPARVTGGSLEKMNGNIYILRAESKDVIIELE